MKESVQAAIAELEENAPGDGVRFQEDGEGGAIVIVDAVPIGDSFEPTRAWIGFRIGHSYPEAAIYPHFIDAGLRYIGSCEAPNAHPDGNLPAAMTRAHQMPGFDLDAIQISRTSPRRAPGTDSALRKLLRVISFLESR